MAKWWESRTLSDVSPVRWARWGRSIRKRDAVSFCVGKLRSSWPGLGVLIAGKKRKKKIVSRETRRRQEKKTPANLPWASVFLWGRSFWWAGPPPTRQTSWWPQFGPSRGCGTCRRRRKSLRPSGRSSRSAPWSETTAPATWTSETASEVAQSLFVWRWPVDRGWPPTNTQNTHKHTHSRRPVFFFAAPISCQRDGGSNWNQQLTQLNVHIVITWLVPSSLLSDVCVPVRVLTFVYVCVAPSKGGPGSLLLFLLFGRVALATVQGTELHVVRVRRGCQRRRRRYYWTNEPTMCVGGNQNEHSRNKKKSWGKGKRKGEPGTSRRRGLLSATCTFTCVSSIYRTQCTCPSTSNPMHLFVLFSAGSQNTRQTWNSMADQVQTEERTRGRRISIYKNNPSAFAWERRLVSTADNVCYLGLLTMKVRLMGPAIHSLDSASHRSIVSIGWCVLFWEMAAGNLGGNKPGKIK